MRHFESTERISEAIHESLLDFCYFSIVHWVRKMSTEITVEVQNEIRKCAREIIAHESVCIEWGASPEQSVKSAEESITELVKRLIYTSTFEVVK